MKQFPSTDKYLWLLSLCTIAFFAPVLSMPEVWSLKYNFASNDILNIKMPFTLYFYEGLHSLKLNLWCPPSAMGLPLLAQIKLGLFYPLNLAFFIFPPFLPTLIFSTVFHYFLLASFMYLYCLKIGLSKEASFISALIMAFNYFTVSRFSILDDLNTMIWLPLFLYVLEQIFCVNDGVLFVDHKKSFLCGGILGVQFLAGHPGFVYFTLLTLIFYMVLLFLKLKTFCMSPTRLFQELIFSGMLIIGMALGIASIAILPFTEYLELSVRKNMKLEESLLYNDVMGMFLKNKIIFTKINFLKFDLLDVGVLPAIFGIFAIIFSKFLLHLKKYIVFYFVLCVFAFFMSLGDGSWVYPFFYKFVPLPFFKFLKKPIRFEYLFVFSIAVLAGLGFDAIKKIVRDKRTAPVLTIVVLALIYLSLFTVNYGYYKWGWRMYPKLEKSSGLSKPKALAFIKKHKGLYRVYFDATNYWIHFDVELSSARTLFLPERYFKFTSADENFSESRQDDSSRIFTRYPNLLNISNTRFVVFEKEHDQDAQKTMSENPNLRLAYEDNDYVILENKPYFPRAIFVNNARFIDNSKQILAMLKSRSFNPLESVLLETNERRLLDQSDSTADYEMTSIDYLPNKTIIKINNRSEGFLVLFDLFYPGWKAWVDGVPSPIYRADFLFRSVHLNSGRHIVTFTYVPWSAILGTIISILSFLVLITLIFLKQKRWHLIREVS